MAIQAQMYSGLTALGSSQDMLLENACGLNNICFVSQQEQEFMQRIQVFQKNMDDQSFSAHCENQRIEIDLFINSQNERLRLALQEQRKQQTFQLTKKYESKIQMLIKQKEEEIAKAANRRMELQNLVKRMEMERETWQRVAKENESMVASLNSTIQRLRESDAESCCLETEQERKKMVCRSCNCRDSCIVILPCRHLCSCKYCEAFIDFCPVCKMVKKASIEALV